MSQLPIALSEPVLRACCDCHEDWEQLTDHLMARFFQVPAVSIQDEIDRARAAMTAFDLPVDEHLITGEMIIRNNLLMRTGQIADVARLDPECHVRAKPLALTD